MKVNITSVETYRTVIIEIEHEDVTYSVNAQENPFDWDFHILDVDNCEEVTVMDNPELWDLLVDAAEEAINNQ